jgi:hypothetical protein
VELGERRVYRFVTSAEASVDALALARSRLARLDLVLDVAALVVAVMLVATGNLLLAVLVAGIRAVPLAVRRSRPLQRWIMARRSRSLLGQPTEAAVDAEGLHLENPLGSSSIPWASITEVRSGPDTVVFLRGNALVGYIPAPSFASPAEQAEVVTFARARIAPPG